ncbi:MAG TPA: alpha/beta fold hydrolase [Mycobacterium sp.]|nr:alpha/beta fold hydrolase [Mycobacterium sp.]HUH71778.1 alpha/beta fold hydrolase [Mycobacterium sp.]
MKVDFANKTVGGFNFEFVRGLSLQAAGAAEYGECMDTMSRVKNNNFDSWITQWAATADRVAAFAEGEDRFGNTLSARNAFLRASNYYRMAVFYASHTDARHTQLWRCSKDCFHRMITLMDTPIECVDIEFEKARLPAYFVSGGAGRRPTLIALGGFDSTMEELYCWLGAAPAYGWNCLMFEGPGQWSALKANPGLTFRPDYEKPVGAVVDYLLTRCDVDPGRLAIIGYSMGGYLATRAALDQRIRAVIPNSLVVDCGAAARAGMKGLMKNTAFMDAAFKLVMKVNTPARWGFQHSEWTLGIRNAHEWVEVYQPYSIKGFADRYHNPMLFLFSEDDIHDAAAPSAEIIIDMLDFVLALDCDRYLRLFTRTEGASSHCQMGGLSYAQTVIFDWLNHILDGGPAPAPAAPAAADLFVSQFAKYGKAEGEIKAKQLLSVAQLI